MKLKILGSGGCLSLPRPTCDCRVCKEAREQLEPYKRTSCSLFIEDRNILIDTPEDITYQLNRDNIKKVEKIFYSHWDPDHTMGMRVLEQLHKSWRVNGVKESISVIALEDVIDDIMQIKNKFSSYFEYYEKMKLCSIKKGSSFTFEDFNITLYPVVTDIVSTVFLFRENNKKVIYAPCDIKPFPYNNEFYDADLLIIGSYVPNNFVTDKKIVGTDIGLYSELYTINEILKIKKDLKIKNVVITHIEEEWGLSYDDYKNIEKEYNNEIIFAFDSMEILI